MKFSEKLQKLRKENNLSQEQLADMLDVSRQSVSKWESGQTYPEMDKLISMCKIFKCSLDDLTNDEVTEISSNVKSKNSLSNWIDELLDLIKKTYNMVRNMNGKQIIKMIIEMFIVFILLLILQLPIHYISSLVTDMFMSFGLKIGITLSNIFNFVISIAYFVLSIIIFVYIYKFRYLDNYKMYTKNTNNINNNTNNDNNAYSNTIKTTNVEKRSSVFIDVLGKIVMILIKSVIAFFTLPFIGSLLFLCSIFIISIILMFKGVLYIGITLGVIFAVTLNIIIIELVFDFIFNKRVAFKRMLISFLVSIVGIGFSLGIALFEIANTAFINDVPNNEKKEVIKNTFEMNDQLIINSHYENIEYVVNEDLNNSIVVETSYYKDYQQVIVDNNNNYVIVSKTNPDNLNYKKILNYIIKDLANKEIHNYNNLYEVSIKVYASSNNINKLKDNYQKQIEEQYNIQSEMEYYETEISRLETEKRELESKNEELKYENEELKNNITEYKDRIKEVLE